MQRPEQLNAGAAPAWYPDPTGRFGLRWWDGQAWSSHVHGPGGYTYDPVPFITHASKSTTGTAVVGIALLATSLLPTILAGLLLWLAVTTALSNPIEGMATFSFWVMSALSSVTAGVLVIVALAVTTDAGVTQRARRTALALGLGVIAVNTALVVVPIVSQFA
ncbi:MULTISPECIES: DUF2510 domain-containing protein [unclassified Microbacterium]|uniref:DUF2510 domain-containing protein n=1 Tax=unclassified Microbacterium TaxID=2609290 RepID=UPI00214A902B|nr:MULTISPECIES: DUF2510 domain-containing protein [unclassified Microbacterium]MCR2785730.1 DUF2510 domain-containing protein [Microbacterium sp. zg.B96]WIM17286.1 DUF2510 domain-containing protein [Microbacterium sp. zg-B96]